MRAHAGWIFVILASLAVTSRTKAQALPVTLLYTVDETAQGCATEAAFRELVRSKLDADVAMLADRSVVVAVHLSGAPGAYRGEIALQERDRTVTAHRSFSSEAETCAEASNTAALRVSIALAALVAEAREALAAHPPTPAPRPAAPPPDREWGPRASGWIGGTLGVRRAPSLSFGGHASFAFSARWLELELGFGAEAPTAGSHGLFDAALVAGDLAVCARLLPALDLCALAAVGDLRVTANVSGRDTRAHALWAAAGARVAWAERVVSWFFVRAHIDLLFTVGEVVVRSSDAILWNSPVISGLFGIDLGARSP